MTSFINVQISNEDGFAEVEDKNPIDSTIHGYVDMIVRALNGLTFSTDVIYDGLKAWCAENGDDM